MSSMCNFVISRPVHSQLRFEVGWGRIPIPHILFLDWAHHSGRYQPYETNACNIFTQISWGSFNVQVERKVRLNGAYRLMKARSLSPTHSSDAPFQKNYIF